MRRKSDFVRAQLQLLGDFSQMTVVEYAVSREIVRHRNEMRARCRFLACSGYSGLRVSDNSLFAIGETRFEQRREAKDYGRRIATGVGDDARAWNFVGV